MKRKKCGRPRLTLKRAYLEARHNHAAVEHSVNSIAASVSAALKELKTLVERLDDRVLYQGRELLELGDRSKRCLNLQGDVHWLKEQVRAVAEVTDRFGQLIQEKVDVPIPPSMGELINRAAQSHQ